MTFLDDVATIITTATTGFTVGGVSGNLGKQQMDDTQPSTMVGLFRTAGPGPAYTFSTGTQTATAFEAINLQVMSRSTSYVTAENNANLVYSVLSGAGEQTVNGLRYRRVTALQAPYGIGHDDNDRYLVVCNYTVERDST
jgi:hypothetical protein